MKIKIKLVTESGHTERKVSGNNVWDSAVEKEEDCSSRSRVANGNRDRRREGAET